MKAQRQGAEVFSGRRDWSSRCTELQDTLPRQQVHWALRWLFQDRDRLEWERTWGPGRGFSIDFGSLASGFCPSPLPLF